MDSQVIELSSGDIRNGKINVRPCDQKFFPEDVFGGSTKKNPGNKITIHAAGLNTPFETDIPKEKSGKRPRWFFRERGLIKEFIRANNFISGDKVEIRHVRNRIYELIPHKSQLTFIDLFAGIGGTRLAFEAAGCKCVFSSEWDKFAQQTYEANFGEKPHGDIRQIQSSEIPDHDILVAGFPCQPFSISGISKKNALGKPHGFDDPTQGTLFFE
jgi:hypothetical protein